MRYLLALFLCCSLGAADAVTVCVSGDYSSWTGTAFPVGKRTLLTAGHNMTDGPGQFGKLIEYGWLIVKDKLVPFTLVKHSREDDIALIEVSEDLEAFELGDDAPKGKECFLNGFRRDPVLNEKAKIDKTGAREGLTRCKTKNFGRGMSGGPVVRNGKVIGMIVQGDWNDNHTDIREDTCYFIPVSVLKKFMSAEPDKPAPAPQQCTTLK